MKVYIDTNDIPTMQLKKASLRKHYIALLKKDIVSQDTVKKFAKDLESLKYCSKTIVAVALFFCNISFSQSEIVIGSGSLGNGNFVIGGNIIDTPLLVENKFTKKEPIPIPKPRSSRKGMKYKKSEAQKLKEALRKLTLKN